MSFNGSGTFLINTAGQPVVAGTVISSTAFNALTADLATGLSTVITKDGQTTVTANIPMSTYKFTGLGVGSAATDSANLSQVQSTVTKLLTSVSGTDTITAVGAPVVAAYAAGQMFYFVATGDNTGAVTLNIDSLGAKAVTRDGSVALAAGDIKSGEVVVVVYDGTRFQVVSQLNSAGNATFANVSITSALNVGGVATFTANPVLSGGTANGVLYLNGSKVATSGSALTFDGTNLAVGASPGFYGAQVATAGSISITGGNLLKLWNTGGTGVGGISSPGTDTIAFGLGASFTEGMRLTTTGLGIGTTSPGTILDLGTSTGQKISVYRNANIRYGFGIETDTMRYYVPTGASNAVHSFGQISTTDGTTYTERLRLDSSGNLGLGVTPRAWAGGYKSFDITGPGAIASTASGDTFTQVANGAWFNGTNWIYQYTGIGAARYQMTGPSGGGNHSWHTAASGTAGNTISFTQAMTLDASGRLLIGLTSGTEALSISSSDIYQISFKNSSGSAAAFGADSSSNLRMYANGSERARITSGGDLLVGRTSASAVAPRLDVQAANFAMAINTTNGGSDEAVRFYNNGSVAGSITTTSTTTAYNVSSDQRLKKNIQDAPAASDLIDAIQVRSFDWKFDDSHQRYGMVAQELLSVAPEAVYKPEDPDDMMAVDYSKLVPMLVKEIQSLRARVAQLESK
jgi:hypothetical protein